MKKDKEKKVNRKKSLAFKIIISIVMLFVAIIVWIGADVVIGVMKKDAPRRPSEVINTEGVANLTWVLNNPGLTHPDIAYTSDTLTSQVVESEIAGSVQYINSRYDCSDFRAIDLLKLYFVGGTTLQTLSPVAEDTIEDTLSGFKFWITSEGEDSMCYHSENHEALFGVVEYLSGMIYPDTVFSIDGKAGSEHAAIARTRLLTWMELRFDYGFSEHLSQNYYPVDLAAMSMLVQYGDHTDTELITKASIILDLLYYDYASQVYDGTFINVSGRSYDHNNGGGYYNDSNSYKIVDYVWSLGQYDHLNDVGGHAFLVIDALRAVDPETSEHYYEIPEVILEIGRSTGEREVKASYGLDLSELQGEDLIGLSDRQLMFMLGMGAKTNSEVINTILDMMDEYDLWHNNFLSSFKYINIHLFRMLGIMPALMNALQPSTNGSAIQRGNIYTYITDNYKLSTNQSYHPGVCGDQQTLSIATLPDGLTVYTTHPFRKECDMTPGYWAGFGVAPDSAQDKNVLMSIYDIPDGKILMAPADTLQYTHTLFPEELLDECVIDGKYAFGRKGNTYIALIGAGNLYYKPYDQAQAESLELDLTDNSKSFDLVQDGAQQFWIYELSSASKDGNFVDFQTRVKSNSLSFIDMTLSYTSDGVTRSLAYNGNFTVDGTVIDLNYDRFDSPYINAERKSSSFSFNYAGHTLMLDFDNYARTLN